MKTTSYYFLVLDIETSTLFNDEKEPTAVWLSYGFCNLYDCKGNRLNKCYFRDWITLQKFFILCQQKFVDKKIICFVHNLGYEFDFLIKNISRPNTILSNSSHAVISSCLNLLPQIEFRCTFRLSMLPLKEIGRLVNLPKLDSEYRTITPDDEVTPEEVEYCCRDCDIVAQYIAKILIPEFGYLRNIPYTKTGRVRKTYKSFYNEMVKCNKCQPEWDLMPPEDCYPAMLDAFAGGICTSNPLFTGRILHNVQSYDITSSYPFAQLSELYPYTIEREPNPSLSMLNETFWIAKLKFNNIKSRFNWGWLSISKMNDYSALKCRFFNGKLLNAEFCIRTITNVDYEMICQTYTFDSVEVLEFYHEYKCSELPYPYIETIKLYAQTKSELKEKVKHIPENDTRYLEQSFYYLLAKGDFNSIYGMSVQKLMQSEYTIDDQFVWKEVDPKYKQTNKHIGRNFLYGIYTTAYARKNLLTAIIQNCPQTFVYCDTDSVKFIGSETFKDTNKDLPEKYVSIKALSKLGRFDKEHEYETFATYGAKKYAHTFAGDSKLYLTIAGLPKYNSTEGDIKTIDQFKLGIVFKKCKLGKKYIYIDNSFELDDDNNIINKKEMDGETKRYLLKHHIETNGGVALYPVDYSLDMTEHDIKICKEQQEVLPKWLKTYKALNGIDLTESCGTTLLTE